MLKELNVDQARFVALLAKTARAQRDDLLGNVPEDDLADLKAARGEHNPDGACRIVHADAYRSARPRGRKVASRPERSSDARR